MELRGAYWRDVGTPGEYRQATADVLEGRVVPVGARATGVPASAQRRAATRASRARCASASDAEIASGARIVGPSVIGDGVRVGPARRSSAASSGTVRDRRRRDAARRDRRRALRRRRRRRARRLHRRQRADHGLSGFSLRLKPSRPRALRSAPLSRRPLVVKDGRAGLRSDLALSVGVRRVRRAGPALCAACAPGPRGGARVRRRRRAGVRAGRRTRARCGGRSSRMKHGARDPLDAFAALLERAPVDGRAGAAADDAPARRRARLRPERRAGAPARGPARPARARSCSPSTAGRRPGAAGGARLAASGRFGLRPGLALPREVTLLDDVCTTGATLRDALWTLRDHAVEVRRIVVVARALDDRQRRRGPEPRGGPAAGRRR